MRFALQGHHRAEILIERFGQHLDRNVRIGRPRLSPAQIDGFEHPAHAALADQRDEAESALQDIPDANARGAPPTPLAEHARGDGGLLGPSGDLQRNRIVNLGGQRLRRPRLIEDVEQCLR